MKQNDNNRKWRLSLEEKMNEFLERIANNLLALFVVAGFFFILYAKITKKTMPDILGKIKEILGGGLRGGGQNVG